MAELMTVQESKARAADGPNSTRAGAGWFYGAAYMVPIGRADAARLCGPGALPRVGYVRDVRTVPDKQWPSMGPHRLEVHNISGAFWLACCTASREQWPALFSVGVQ